MSTPLFTQISQKNSAHHLFLTHVNPKRIQNAVISGIPPTQPNINSHSNPRDLPILLAHVEVNTDIRPKPVPPKIRRYRHDNEIDSSDEEERNCRRRFPICLSPNTKI